MKKDVHYINVNYEAKRVGYGREKDEVRAWSDYFPISMGDSVFARDGHSIALFHKKFPLRVTPIGGAVIEIKEVEKRGRGRRKVVEVTALHPLSGQGVIFERVEKPTITQKVVDTLLSPWFGHTYTKVTLVQSK